MRRPQPGVKPWLSMFKSAQVISMYSHTVPCSAVSHVMSPNMQTYIVKLFKPVENLKE